MNRKILIVDDIEANRMQLRKILCDEYDIVEAKDGKEALFVLKHSYKHLSAVLLDISMPVIDGYEVLKRISVNPLFSQVPVLITTESADGESEVKALALGAKDFIAKPFTPEVIRRRLKNIIKLRETAATVNALQRDNLTGLLARETFFQKADKLIASNESGYYAIACLDIDDFKVINDRYGSRRGDEILKLIADIFQRGVDMVGGLSCRITADIFALLYPYRLMSESRFRKILDDACMLDGLISPISISAGKYIVDDKSLPVSAMYDRAAIAKKTVKGRYDAHIAQYDKSMMESILRKQEIINDMNTALSEEQFEVWLQPQYNHSTGALIGAESLVRWRHPKKGLISPGEFIPVFESNGFIYEMDKYVWERTCILLSKWIKAERMPLPVSVNISRYDIFCDDFIETITGLVQKYDIPVELLRLEITESAFAKSTHQIINVVKQLIEYGFTMEIDDFGSGYSSFNTLKDVPAQILKLDMRFLDNDDHSGRGGNIIESIVRMTKWLGMSIIAEGVEDAEHAEFLKTIGCSYVQGYLYAKPMPVSDYETLAANIDKEEKLLVLETVENLNNNAFWDPKSIDTLIFNSYVGGACIFEYCQGKVEMLRATNKLVRMLSESLSVEDALKLSWNDYIDSESSSDIADAVKRSFESKDEIDVEVVFVNLPKCKSRLYVRSTIRVIAVAGDRFLIYCINENVTAQREAERNERKASERMQAIMDHAGSGITATVAHGENVRYLFANDKYYKLLGYTRKQYEAEVKNVYDTIHPDDRKWVLDKAVDITEDRRTEAIEYRVIRRDGRIIWLRNVISITRFDGIKVPVQLGIFTDITEEKNTIRKIQETDEQLKFLNDTAGDLLAQTDAESGIESVLRKTLEYFGGDRSFIYEYDYEEKTCLNTYEVCAPGQASYMNKYNHFSMDSAIHWLKTFETSEFFYMDNPDALGAEREMERESYEILDVRSVLAVALRANNKVIGTMGVFNPKQHLSDYNNLAALGTYMAVILTRRNLNAKIESDRKNLQNLMDDTPGAFARMRISKDGTIKTNYVNETFCKLRGMTFDEIIAEDSENSFVALHPDDIDFVKESIVKLFESGGVANIKYRLKRSDGTYIPLNAFGRMSKNEFGERFLNVYYADMSEQEKKDLSVRDAMPFILSTIMASSTDLAFAKDKNFVYICCSPAFAKFAGQENESGVIGKTDFELFSKEIAEQFRKDDVKLFTDGVSLVDYIEPIPSNDGIQHYSSTSKYLMVDTTGNIIGLYGIGRDVTEYRSAFERLKMLTDNIPGGIASYVCTNESIKITYFNDGFCKMLGYSREEYEEISKTSVMNITFEDDIPMVKEQINALYRDNVPLNCVYRVHNRNGEGYKWVNLRGNIGERNGDTCTINTVLYDVTEAKLAEEALHIKGKEQSDESIG